MISKKQLIAGIAIIALVVVIAAYVGACEADADTIHDVLAIEAVPELGHENVTAEFATYYSAGTENYMDLGKDAEPIFSGGAAVGAFGFSVGAAIVHDRDSHQGMVDTSVTSGAVAITIPTGHYGDWMLGVATSIDDGGASFDRLTFGAKLRFGF